MSNGYLTVCALLIASLITGILFKKSVSNIETRIFKKMLICNILESLSTTLIVVVALTNNSLILFKLLNRIDVILIITWCSLMFYYIYMVLANQPKPIIKRFIMIFNFICVILALILDVNIIVEDNILNSTGPLTILGLIGALIYIILMMCTLFFMKNRKKEIDNFKFTPFYVLINLLIIVAIFRIVMPNLNVISIMISFVDLIMIFTIENPDVRMLNELQLAKMEVEKSSRAKSDFISSMSHEIRTPLNAVIGFGQLIEYSETLEEAKENSKDIIKASNDLLTMVTNILDISSLETENVVINNVEYNPYDEFNSVVQLFSKRIEEKKLKIKTVIFKKPKSLIGDPTIIKKILVNILDNAVKYTEKGNIFLTIKYEKKNLIIILEDTGVGIKKEYLANIFETFAKTDDTKNSNKSGVGLGLSITKKLVDLLHGSIKIESEYSKFTKVTIKLKQGEKK